MKTSTPLKIVTIFLFLLLIVVFVFYHTGGFSETTKPADMNGFFATAKLDTVPAAFRDSVLREYRNGQRQLHMMSGSKSGVVIPKDNLPLMKAMVDSLWRKRLKENVHSGNYKRDSATVAFLDSMAKVYKKDRKDRPRGKPLLPGSKSAEILPRQKQ
jgi:hypothetical protein